MWVAHVRLRVNVGCTGKISVLDGTYFSSSPTFAQLDFWPAWKAISASRAFYVNVEQVSPNAVSRQRADSRATGLFARGMLLSAPLSEWRVIRPELRRRRGRCTIRRRYGHVNFREQLD